MEGKSLTDRNPMEASGGTNVKGVEDLRNLPINFRGNLVSATTDKELSDLLSQAKSSKRPVVVNYGATWCHACRQMLPTFCNASNENSKTLFIYADMDSVSRKLRMFVIHLPSAFKEMEIRWMSFTVQDPRDFVTGFGCILEISPDSMY